MLAEARAAQAAAQTAAGFVITPGRGGRGGRGGRDSSPGCPCTDLAEDSPGLERACFVASVLLYQDKKLLK